MEKGALNIELFTEVVFMPKLEYIHYIPEEIGLRLYPERYIYSPELY